MNPKWTEEDGIRLELAVEVLAGEVGRRSVELRTLSAGDEDARARLSREMTSLVHLHNRLRIDDERRISAILERNIDEALRDEEPLLQSGQVPSHGRPRVSRRPGAT